MDEPSIDLLKNEAASFWVGELVRTSDQHLVKEAIDRVLLAGDGELEREWAECGIAAAEVVAIARGAERGTSYSEQQIDEWLKTIDATGIEGLAYKASYVLERVGTPPSELLSEWNKSPNSEGWKKALAALKKRLGV